jgi:hypothetical protein
MALPNAASPTGPESAPAGAQSPTGASGTRFKVATRPSTVGATWLDLFHPGTESSLGLDARVRVVADIAGALIQIHTNTGIPKAHRRHGRLTPRHILVGVDGSASLFTSRDPFGKLLPPQPDLGYLAPEILNRAGTADPQSDVFSLGVLLWEALDNGRLFPHRRAEAIVRLISRASLPAPRVDEEWARPLRAVASKALSREADERYPDATAFWLALREHLPPPQEARAGLARQAQLALKLELTADIRDEAPYLVKNSVLASNTVPLTDVPVPSTSSAPLSESEPSARYSLRPGSSNWDGPASTAAPRCSITARRPSARPTPGVTSRPASAVPAARTPSRAPDKAAPAAVTRSKPPAHGSTRPNTAPAPSVRPSEPLLHTTELPVSTLRVSLPPDLVDSSLPYYLSTQAPQKPFPWGALSFAAIVFFGVGAAVALGAVSALRSTQTTPPLSVQGVVEGAQAPPSVQLAVPNQFPHTQGPPVTEAETSVPSTGTGTEPNEKPAAAASAPSPSGPHTSKASTKKARKRRASNRRRATPVRSPRASAKASDLPFTAQPY